MTELIAVPMKPGRSLAEHFELNHDFIRQCHEQNIAADKIGAAIGLFMPRSNLYHAFGQYQVGRKHMGFIPIHEAVKKEQAEKIKGFKQRVTPRDKKNLSVLGHLLAHSDLIEEMHRGDFAVKDLADVLGAVSYTHLTLPTIYSV